MRATVVSKAFKSLVCNGTAPIDKGYVAGPFLNCTSCRLCRFVLQRDQMVQRTDVKPQGKAWWVQLQHQRAVDAGCHFYSYRPATSSPVLSKQPATSLNYTQGSDTRRPMTSVSVRRSPEDTHGAFVAPATTHGPCLMRPCTSPKLPARRALGSRQASRSQMSSTAVSHQLPASRGNDWSPVHSRPATRSAISNMHKVKHPAEAQIQPPGSPGLTVAADSNAAEVLAMQPAQPAIPKHRQLRPNRSCCLSNKQSPTVRETVPHLTPAVLAATNHSACFAES